MKYEELKEEDIEAEDIKLDVSKSAFLRPLTCSDCKIKMKAVHTDFDLPDGSITIHLIAYRCPKCGQERLSGEQAIKFENLLLASNALRGQSKLSFERAMNFDGRSFFIRFPHEMTAGWNKNMLVEIAPIDKQDFFIRVKSKN